MGASVGARRLATRGAAAAVTAVALAAGVQCVLPGAQASVARPRPVVNPYSPAYHHPYRRGVVPTIGRAKLMKQWARSHPSAGPTSANDLNYGGGIDGIGVTTGPEKVYLVFYGSQWGTQGTNSSGDVTLSGDPLGEAPYLQELMKGLGTGGELWSGVMTQYCDGVAVGAQSCPASNTEHVAYPTGGALAGVWVDESASSPHSASGHDLGVIAVAAAAHFGNTTAASNRDAQYVIASPTGTDPDGWLENGFCAWHDYNGDPYLTGGPVSSPYGDIAFTNLPYQPDAEGSCGAGFVNPTGYLDGVSIVEGHEYAETITDQNPAGGWTDTSGNEAADKCAWIPPGTPGGAFDLSTGHGTFAMQTIWANDGAGGAGACEASHPIVTDPSNVVTVTSPGDQAGTVGTAVSLQIQASDSDSGQTLTYSATGLPPGLSISSSTGLISGTPATAGAYSVTVTATDTTGAHGSASFAWTIGKTATTTSVSSSANPSVYDQTVTFTATVTSADGGGSVAFFADGAATPISGCGTQSLAPAGGDSYTAACSTASLPAGSHAISAGYTGDAKASASSGSLAGGQTVNPAGTTTSVSTSGSPSVYGQAVTFTATVTSTDGGGNVAFFADGSPISQCGAQSLAPAGGGAYAATCITSGLPAGSHAISAAYTGDSNTLESSGSLAGGQDVGPAATTTSVSSSGPIVYGQPVTFTATVTSTDGGGSVAFFADGAQIPGCGNQSLAPAGGGYAATCGTSGLPAGEHAISAYYTGDANTSPSSGGLSGGQVVAPAVLTTVVVGAQTYGGSPVFTVTGYAGFVNGDTPSVVTGTLAGCTTSAGPGAGVGVHTGTISGCTGLSSPNYTITYADAGLTVSPAPLTIKVAGTQTYGGSPGFAVTGYAGFVNGDTSSVVTGALSGCATTVVAGAGVGTYPGTISGCSGLSSPNYTLTYADAGFTVTPAQLLIIASNGTMTYGSVPPAITPAYAGFVNGDDSMSLTTQPTCSTTATSSSGVGAYEATCAGAADPNYAISYFPGTVTVNPAAQAISFIAPSTGAAGGSAALTATGGGSGNPVTFTVDSTSGAGVCTVSGATVTYKAAGSCVIDANQAGSANYTAAPQVTGTITVTKAAPALATTAGPTVVVAGAPLTDTATLSGGASPTGTITFTLSGPGNTVVYTDHVTVNGNGSYTTAAGDNPGGYRPTTVGTYQWAVSYSGDPNNTAATAATETQAAVYGLGGFTAPLPKSTLQKSGSTIPVKFTLTNAAGQPISATTAAALATAGDVRATLSGPKITTVSAVCTWNTTGLFFQCNIKTPTGVVTGSAYQITAQENVTGVFITAPAVSTATTPNPETVYFK